MGNNPSSDPSSSHGSRPATPQVPTPEADSGGQRLVPETLDSTSSPRLLRCIVLTDDDLEYIVNPATKALKLLGKGGSGSVYLARLKANPEELVAVKKAPREYLEFEDTCARFKSEYLHETDILRHLDHPNIIRFVGGNLEEAFFCLEYMRKGDLFNLLSKKDEKVRFKDKGKLIAYQIAMALEFMHKQRYIHRDIKSANILIGDRYTAKIADVGISLRREPHLHHIEVENASFSVRWAAPENWANTHKVTLDEKCDIYSYGVLLWELLTQEIPWHKVNDPSIYEAVSEGKRPPLDSIENLDPDVKSLVERCWHQDPKSRPSAAEIVGFFEQKFPTLPSEVNTIAQAESIYDVPQGKILECLGAGIRHFLRPAQQSELPSSDSRSVLVLKQTHRSGALTNRIDDAAFKETRRTEIQFRTRSNMSEVTCEWVEHCPRIFHKLRLLEKILDYQYTKIFEDMAIFERDYVTAIADGKDFFYYSADHKIYIKELSSAKFATMLETLPVHFHYMESYSSSSLLARLLGAYEIKYRGEMRYLLVSRNIFGNVTYKPNDVYDIKGSFVDRSGEGKHLKKDNDLKEPLIVGPEVKTMLLQQLKLDAELLRAKMGVMDYSLLLGVHDITNADPEEMQSSPSVDSAASLLTLLGGKEDISPLSIIRSANGRCVYTIGLVNSYQCYNTTKRLERFYKRFVRLAPAEGISSAPPDMYFERIPPLSLAEFVSKLVKPARLSPNCLFENRASVFARSSVVKIGWPQCRNILLSKDGTPKISDFGMSRITEAEKEGTTASSVGAVAWMAPESINRKFSEKSDVWMYGCTLWEILSGEAPHRAYNDNKLELALKIRDEGLHPEISKHFPRRLQDVLYACWKYEPSERPTFKQILSMLSSGKKRKGGEAEDDGEVQSPAQHSNMSFESAQGSDQDSNQGSNQDTAPSQ